MTRRALYLLIGGLALFLLARFMTRQDETPEVVVPRESVETVEKRLEHLRKVAATVPGKEQLYGKHAAELAEREKGLIQAANLEQARVSLLELVQKIASENGIDVRGNEGTRHKAVTADYGELTVNVRFTCGIDQLVNMLAAIGSHRPEILATDEIHVNGGNDKKKNIQVRLTVSTPVPRKLLPEKKGPASF